MSLTTIMAASIQLDALAHRYERAFFDLQTCVPLAGNPVQAPTLWTRIDDLRAAIANLTKEKAQVLGDLQDYFAGAPTDFSVPSTRCWRQRWPKRNQRRSCPVSWWNRSVPGCRGARRVIHPKTS